MRVHRRIRDHRFARVGLIERDLDHGVAAGIDMARRPGPRFRQGLGDRQAVLASDCRQVLQLRARHLVMPRPALATASCRG